MKKLSKYLVSLGLMLLVSPVLFSFAKASPSQPHTPPLSLELQSVSSKVYHIAGVMWLPDWQSGFSKNTQNDKGAGDSSLKKNCKSYGYASSCATDMVGTLVSPYIGLSCYKNCVCKPSLPLGAGEVCTKYCGSNCIAKGCKPAVTMVYANDTCTERCASGTSVCTAKSCKPACTSSSSAPYGTYIQDNKCGSTCNIAYADNCRNRSAVSCSYGCQSNWSDCSSKCGSCYADNCRNRTAATVPSNAACTAKFSDCSSKCSAWSCNSGYIQSGNSCVPACAVGDVYYSDRTCSASIISGKKPIGVVGYISNGGRNGLIVALEETKKTWSLEYYDLPCIGNIKGTDTGNTFGEVQVTSGGKANTACIVQIKNSRDTYYSAGMYCANYSISGVDGWFLPASGEAYKTMYLGKVYVNATLDRLGKRKIDINGDWYWSSTEGTYDNVVDNTAWRLRLSDGYLFITSKDSSLRVRCVHEF